MARAPQFPTVLMKALSSMKKMPLLLVFAILAVQAQPHRAVIAQQAPEPAYAKTRLLSDQAVSALAAEINGVIAKDTITELSRYHRVQASSGYSRAAEYVAAKAKEYGLEQVQIERFPADGQKTYY